MRRHVRIPFALLTVAACLAAGAPGSAQEEEPLPAPVFPSIPPEAPAGTGMMQPCMEGLEGEVRCGRYRVWENRETRAGRTIDLAFVVADALDPDADDSVAVTFFFGGPGTDVTAPAAAVIDWRRDLRESRDLLMLDFRGVGASSALDCAVPYPRGVASRFGAIFPLDHVEACRDRLAERTQLDLYTSATNMDDLDELRAWLNYRALDLNGGSYGTREIQVFLRRHQSSARTAILAAVSPIFEGGYVTHARGLQNALDELVAECLGDARCAASYPELRADLAAILDRVRTDPPEVLAEGETVRFGPGELGYALRGLLYGRARELPALITGAAEGDWQPLADYYLRRSGWVSEEGGNAGMHFSVLCAEDIARLDRETIERETAGTFLGDYLVGGYADVCDVWPHARLDPSFWEPVASDVPALLFSGNRDPVTPPAGGDAVAAHLTNSLHIVLAGAGHDLSDPCVMTIERQFVESGSVEGLDTSCLSERPPTEFVLREAAE
jgi:pimeloyl-ACP methyl ester carboxylesterase